MAETASVTGDVVMARDSSLWFGAVLRGDDAAVRIGARTNIQDLTMVHADPGVPNVIGEDCVVGHGAILHGAKVGDRCLIGMGSILLTGSEVGEECIVAAGAVVTQHAKVPPRSVVMGVPGRVTREVTDEEVRVVLESAAGYVVKAREHVAGEYRP